jgi:hypothetical protein
MKKMIVILAVLSFIAVFTSNVFAGPSRAIVQEMGSVIGAGEINVDLDWVSQTVSVASARDTTIGSTNNNNTAGGITLSSLNIGVTENLEVRLGRLPGLRSYITLPVSSPNNYGLTFKTAGFFPGLGIWAAYGLSDLKDMNKGDTSGDLEGSSWRLGAAYTWSGPLVINFSFDFGSDTSKTGGVNTVGDTSTTEFAGAALYPLRENLLVGLELHYALIDFDKAKASNIDKLDVFVPALGARATAGNWTFDAIAALVSTGIKPDASGTDTSTATVIGVPTLRVNYKF